MVLLALIITKLLMVYLWIIIAYVIVSWLLAFGVLNATNPKARQITEVLQKLTDPVLKPLQKNIPPVAGIDLSPIIAIIGIQILVEVVWYLVS